MTRLRIQASFAGSDTTGIVAALRRLGWMSSGAPKKLAIDHEERAGVSLDDALATGGYVQAWFEGLERVFVTTGKLVDLDGLEIDVDLLRLVGPDDFLPALATVPFEVCAFASLHRAAWKAAGYRAPSFGDGHRPLGWAAAFRGRGHDRLVSRNWFRGGFGGMTCRFRDPDMTFVRCHELDADARTALAQAMPVHRQLGITNDTGFLQSNFVYELDLQGLYDPDTRTVKVVVLGREIPNLELLEWAATRALGRDPAQPVDRIAYVFPDEVEGQRELQRLWRYGHECWVIRDGVEVRLDEGYEPPTATGTLVPG